MDKQMVKEFVKRNDDKDTAFIIEVDTIDNLIILVANKDLEDDESSYLTVYDDLSGLDMDSYISKLKEFLEGVILKSTGLWINTL